MMHKTHPLNLIILLVSLSAFAQDEPVKIDFNYASEPLEAAVSSLISRYRLPVMYKSSLLDDQVVSASCQSCSLEQALDQVLSQSALSYRKFGVQYIISKDVSRKGSIDGMVSLKGIGNGVDNVPLLLELDHSTGKGFKLRTTTNSEGRFSFTRLPIGRYVVSISSDIYSNKTSESITLTRQNNSATILIEVNALSMAPEEIVVNNKMSTISTQVGSKHQLNRVNFRGFQGTPGSAFNRLARMPGVSTPDWTAGEINVQGSAPQDTAVYLDGALIEAPAHFTASGTPSQGLIDDDIVESMELISGALPIEYGDSLGGVLNMTTAAPTRKLEASLNISLREAKARTAGTFANDRGSWFFNLRSGSLNGANRLRKSSHEPHYEKDTSNEDFLGKIQYFFNDSQLLSFHTLEGRSNLESSDSHSAQPVNLYSSKENNHTSWLNLRSFWSDRLWSETVFSWATYQSEYHSMANIPELYQREILDTRDHKRQSLAQDWTLEVGAFQYKWGFKARSSMGTFVYSDEAESQSQSDIAVPVPGNKQDIDINSDIDPGGSTSSLSQAVYSVNQNEGAKSQEFGVYASEKVQITDKFESEVALRYDQQSLTGDHQWSPRASFKYGLSDDTTIRANWGRFYQAYNVYQVNLKQHTSLLAPAELGENSNLSLEQRFKGGVSLNAEVYRKAFSSLRERILDINSDYVDSVSLQQGLALRPSSGHASGAQFTLRGNHSNGLDWMCNYTYSRAVDVIDGVSVRRSWDQRHAVNAVINYRFNDTLSMSGSWSWHSGWPTTEVWLDRIQNDNGVNFLHLAHGDLNQASLPAYQRLDLRLDQAISLKGPRKFYWYMEMINLFNHTNVTGYEYQVQQDMHGEFSLKATPRSSDGFQPMMGLRLDF